MSENQQHSPLAAATDGAVIGADDVARLAQQSLDEIAGGLACTRLLVLAYSPHDGLLRGVRTVGFEMPELYKLRITLSSFPPADQAFRTGQIRPAAATLLPEPLRPFLKGELVVVPIKSGERPLAIFVGQIGANVSIRAPQWQERAEQLAAQGALMADMVRLSAAYQEERRLRQATQTIIAAILEGRPLSETAKIITDQISDRLCEERIGLFLMGAQGQYVAAALRHVSPEYADGISRLRRQSPFSARALATHLPYFTPDARNDPQVTPALRALFERENIQSLLIAVLQHGDQIRGALVVYPEGDRHFTPAEMMLFHALADQATLAVAISQQLEQQRDTAILEERNRLAREMHDTVAQSLTGVVMQVEVAETYLAGGDYEAVRTLLASARFQSRKALEDTRRAVQDLAPASLHQATLSQALAEEARQFGSEIGFDVPFIPTGDEQPLSDEQRLALLRIAQEALNNARKHARAQRVRIGLQYGPDSVVLLIEDDGVGFNSAARPAPDSAGGYGLFGMEERGRLLGGEVQIDSTPGWGTRIRASLPYRISRDTPEPRSAATSARGAVPFPQARQEDTSGQEIIRVLIADDHAIVRQGLKDLLEAQGGVLVVGQAENGEQAADLAVQMHPDVVLMDIQMPEVDGLEGLRRIHAQLPELPVIVLTTFQSDSSVGHALAAGARGYLLKDTAPADLLTAIRTVNRGDALFSSSITGRLAAVAAGRGNMPLNDRERDVLQLLAGGARNKEIAASLFITVSTVEKHIASLFSKLSVSNRAEAVRVALNRGLVPK